ncbi:insulin gene enhancer protein ISL-2-like [Megalops cyprinoides]|uniref:insulin gene enhancer protein ISL-2-like n=1 Tax=Megalops cyprinoides TaxID=118141 RepID=UPI001864AD90|nr:insulin gene enhancer protein ISL-2-like [Megalops cyprinoides]
MGDQNNSDRHCSKGVCPAGALWVCAGCGGAIRDPVVLCVGPDQRWHASCLRCAECRCPLEGSASCFLKNGRTLCRGDYTRMFAVKCGGCREAVLPTHLVLKAGGHVYHPKCLRCSLCNRLMLPGDCFTLGSQGLCCQADHKKPEQRSCTGAKSERLKEDGQRPGKGDVSRDRQRGRGGGMRVRTVLSDAQLRALRSCYSQTPRPDAHIKLRLGQLTGLSPRVIRVWFQNKRCKDKRNSLRGASAGDLTCATLLYATARPMVVRTPEPPDLALPPGPFIFTPHSLAACPLGGSVALSSLSASASVNKQHRSAPQSGPFSSCTGACRTAPHHPTPRGDRHMWGPLGRWKG